MKRLFLLLSLLIACSTFATSQAIPTATRTGDFQIGAAFVADFPDYTRHKFYGFGIYADADFTTHLGIEAEFRNASDSIVPQYQRTYEIGPRYFRHYGRYVPYAKVLIGRASMEYPPYPAPAPVVSAATLNYNFVAGGTGLDMSVTNHFSVRADFEYQKWFASTTSPSPNNINGLPRGLTPILYTGGISYHFGPANAR